MLLWFACRSGARIGDVRERDAQGRVNYRVDYLVHDRVVAQGVLLPESFGNAVVEWDPVLWLPAKTSSHEDPCALARFYLDPSVDEAAILLRAATARVPSESRLEVLALYPRTQEIPGAGYRLFTGTLTVSPLPRAFGAVVPLARNRVVVREDAESSSS